MVEVDTLIERWQAAKSNNAPCPFPRVDGLSAQPLYALTESQIDELIARKALDLSRLERAEEALRGSSTLRCMVSGNLVGTDTHMGGYYSCPCPSCRFDAAARSALGGQPK